MTIQLRWETPPRNQGQIVIYSEAVTPSGAVIDERHDRSDRSVTYSWRSTGRRLTQKELSRYGLVEREPDR